MNPRIRPPRAALRLLLGLELATWFLLGVTVVDAQIPVITNPGDLRIRSVNTAFSPDGSEAGWMEMAPMPTGRVAVSAAAANGKIYAIGGAVLNDCNGVPTVEAYDPFEDLWITGLRDMPLPLRYRTAAATLDNLIYIVGGVTTEFVCHDKALDTVQAYDPATDIWSDKPSMRTARLQVGLGVDPENHLLYAVGGATGAAAHRTSLDTVEVFDPAGNNGTGSWTTKQHLNTPRGAPAVAAFNGKIYAIGGQNEEHGEIATVEEFDPDANGGFGAWTTKPSVMPHPRSQSAAAIVNDRVYVMGGTVGGTGDISTVDVYDPSLDTWTTDASMPTARNLLGAAVVGDTIYGMGGGALVARVGEQFTYQITATNNPFSYDAYPLPDGLTIDRDRGIISGVPTTPAQDFPVTFKATNASGSGFREVNLYIAYPSPLPELETIVSGTCVTGRAGRRFDYQILAQDVNSEVNFAATGLPYRAGSGPEMTIDPGTGLISGMVPRNPDGNAQSFGVGLGLLNVDSAQSYLQLTFVSDPLLPVITSATVVPLVLNQFFSYTITADAPTTSIDYLGLDGLLNGSLPSGLSFDAATGTISGIYSGDASTEGSTCPDSPDTIKKEPPPRRLQLFTRNEPIGTGTGPLNFLVSLHDWEAETLSTQASEGAKYTILRSDGKMSRSAAGLLKSGKVGDYVTYTVPVEKSGTYEIRVGIGTSQYGGIVQLSIDGTKQGPGQDTYTPGKKHEVRDLGPATFSSPGNKTFQFLVTGRRRTSGGHEFVCDYIDLVPFFEAETLPVPKHTAPYTTIYDSKFSGGAATLFQAKRLGDYLTYTVPIPRAGTYNIRVKTAPTGSTASFQLFIDGVKQGYAQKGEFYSALDSALVRDLGTARIESAGDKTFQFVITRHGETNGGYDVIFDDIEIVLATHLEVEALPARANKALERVKDAHMSGQAGIIFEAEAPGDAVSYKIKVPVAGTYQVKAGIRTGNKGGIAQLAMDGMEKGATLDAYSASVGYEVLDLGRMTFGEAGDKAFRFEVTGKNAESEGYLFVLDYVDLVR